MGSATMKLEFKQAFLRSYVFRIITNAAFMLVAHFAMKDTVAILHRYNTDISSIKPSDLQQGLFLETASYIFDETAILSTQAGLMIVALMALLFGLGHFKVKAKEKFDTFRLRLLLYTVSHLFSCLILSLYLMCAVGLLAYPESFRLNSHNSFIWIYPSYALIIVIYVADLYKFFTEND